MKKVIDGIEIIKNEASLYINGRMQYQAVNLVEEYGQRLNGCKYAVASKHPQWKMEKRFSKSLDRFRPYIFMTADEFSAVRTAQQNDEKFHKREVNNHDLYAITDELTEILHDCEILCADPEPDQLTVIIEKEERKTLEKYISALPEALASLTDTQRRRLIMHFYDNKSLHEIAEAEGVDYRAAWQSIEAALKKMEKYFKKF